MAITINDMSNDEIKYMTKYMLESGNRLDLKM